MALIPPFFTDCVVAIGHPERDQTKWIASGFLYARVLSQLNEQTTFVAFLVTNRHVLEGRTNAKLRFNPQANDDNAREYDLILADAEDHKLWTPHPDSNVDVGVIAVNYELLQQQAMRVSCVFPPNHSAPVEHLRASGIAEGDSVFVLGFPMGLVGERRNTVIVRQGCIASIRDVLDGSAKSFLVDAVVFPGNSGGPVVTRPEVIAITGTSIHNDARVIGVVASYVPYTDVAISTQTQRPRVTFEENSGLTSVYCIDAIEEAIDAAMSHAPDTEAQPAITEEADAGAVAPVETPARRQLA